ncbi:hypothetical protein Tco_1069019 [Tanacetum coccineum]|uniref:Uncharacterized protein n=1 Tax=Tanacetum coccineum TaxID=301880 RepID=A0ABQ5HHB8_9ASTR
MPSFPPPEPKASYFDYLDFLKDFENEFLAIVYNDALTSKSDSSTEPVEIPHRIDKFDLKTETSLSECDEEEQNVLYINDLFPFSVIYPDNLKSDKDNDNDKIDIEHPLGDMYLAFGRHLEEIHVTWAHLEKKQTRLRTNTKTLQDLKSHRLETVSPFIHDAVTLHLVMASQHFLTASARTDSTRIRRCYFMTASRLKRDTFTMIFI